jgi:hypothetical protein
VSDDRNDVLAELEAELPGFVRRRSAGSSASVTTLTTNVIRGLADSEGLDTAAPPQIAGSGAGWTVEVARSVASFVRIVDPAIRARLGKPQLWSTPGRVPNCFAPQLSGGTSRKCLLGSQR